MAVAMKLLKRVSLKTWLRKHYDRLMDVATFFGYIMIGIAIAYEPSSDSMFFIQRATHGLDKRIFAWIFFILPSPVFLLKRYSILKFAGLAPLAFVLVSISWFVLMTPNRSWFVAPAFSLMLVRICIHYLRLISEEYDL